MIFAENVNSLHISFTIFLGKWTIPWRSNLKNKKGVFFFQANDLAFHTHSMRLLSGKAETFYYFKKENPWHYRQKT